MLISCAREAHHTRSTSADTYIVAAPPLGQVVDERTQPGAAQVVEGPRDVGQDGEAIRPGGECSELALQVEEGQSVSAGSSPGSRSSSQPRSSRRRLSASSPSSRRGEISGRPPPPTRAYHCVSLLARQPQHFVEVLRRPPRSQQPLGLLPHLPAAQPAHVDPVLGAPLRSPSQRCARPAEGRRRRAGTPRACGARPPSSPALTAQSASELAAGTCDSASSAFSSAPASSSPTAAEAGRDVERPGRLV